jgi:primase-polymerase (primpol)-like protein
MAKCKACGGPLGIGGRRGRLPSTCSDRCRQALSRAAAIPLELRSRDRWVRHLAKRPIQLNGRAASVTNPATWAPYQDAKASPRGDGLGFVLGDGIGGLDLDGVLASNGRLAAGARTLLDVLPAT